MKKALLTLLALLPLVAMAQEDYSEAAPSEEGQTFAAGLFLVVGLLLYFVPSFVGRKHRQSESIILLNLFLGWTLIGWVVALVWATSKPAPVKTVAVAAPFSAADELQKLQKLYESGALSQEELQAERAKVLARS